MRVVLPADRCVTSSTVFDGSAVSISNTPAKESRPPEKRITSSACGMPPFSARDGPLPR